MNKKDAADFLGTSERAIERYAHRGKLSVRYQKGQRGDEAVYDEKELRKLRAELEGKRGVIRAAVDPPDTPDTNARQLVRVSEQAGALQAFESFGNFGQQLLASIESQAVGQKILLTLKECRMLTGLSDGFLREAIKAGKLKARILGRGYKVKRADLDAYVRKL